jgi:hypothetical protein
VGATPGEPAYDSDPCVGTDLDIGSLSAQALCNLDRTAAPLPEGLTARLSSDTVSAIAGEETEIRLSGHVVGVTIDAGGEAYLPITVPSQVALLADKDCTEYPSRILSPGAYTLMLRTAFAEKPLTATMNVTRIVRLPRKRCQSYAKKVAAVAEPQESLRSKVATDLEAQCKRKQPAKVFADCQLKAKTAEELQACNF